MDRRVSVAVLGAGLSGAVAARRLHQAGFGVTVLDKGRGIGGRMATRRIAEAGLAFDHGAQFMRAHGPDFAACLADWCARGVAAPWGAPDRFVGTPGMTAPVRDLLAGLDVRSDRTVTGLARDGTGWRLAIAEAEIAERFDAVVISFPAPQTVRLLAASGLSLAGPEKATYAPCWSLMLALDGPAPFAEVDLRPTAGLIAYVSRDDSKPDRASEQTRLVVHATPDWSRIHLEDERDTVIAALLDALVQIAGSPLKPVHASAHRWRYAMVETALGQDCVYDPALRLGACGDWCLGPRVEAAFDSGAAAAARVIGNVETPGRPG